MLSENIGEEHCHHFILLDLIPLLLVEFIIVFEKFLLQVIEQPYLAVNPMKLDSQINPSHPGAIHQLEVMFLNHLIEFCSLLFVHLSAQEIHVDLGLSNNYLRVEVLKLDDERFAYLGDVKTKNFVP